MDIDQTEWCDGEFIKFYSRALAISCVTCVLLTKNYQILFARLWGYTHVRNVRRCIVNCVAFWNVLWACRLAFRQGLENLVVRWFGTSTVCICQELVSRGQAVDNNSDEITSVKNVFWRFNTYWPCIKMLTLYFRLVHVAQQCPHSFRKHNTALKIKTVCGAKHDKWASDAVHLRSFTHFRLPRG